MTPNSNAAASPRGKARIALRSILTWAPILISLIALLFTAQTYYVAHRPYVGVVEVHHQVHRDDKNQPTAMSWQFVIKNTGASPALVTTEQRSQLIKGERRVTLPVIGPPHGSILLMPNQTANISGGFPNTGGLGTVGEVLNGQTLLTVGIDMSYTAVGWWWWRNTFVYRLRARFMPESAPPGFGMDSGFAD